MPTIELTEAEASEVVGCLTVELENCEEELLREYPKGGYDADGRKSYQKAVRLLKSAIQKFKEASYANH